MGVPGDQGNKNRSLKNGVLGNCEARQALHLYDL